MVIEGRKFLVTGSAGFIGSHTVDALIEQGAQVSGIDQLTTGRRANLNPKARFFHLNIADPRVKEIFEEARPDVVYHFAFNVLVPKSVEDPLCDMDSIAGSVNVLKNAAQFGVERVIFSSSGFVYGNVARLPIQETQPHEAVSPYAVAKGAVENYLKFFGKGNRLPFVTLRYATVYGPRQVSGAMADYFRKLAAGKQAEMWGDGTKTRDYVYIDDVVRANLLALELPLKYPDPVFNVGTGVETTLNELYRKVARLLGKDPHPIFLPERPGELLRYYLDCSKIRNALGWEPRFDLDTGLRRTLESSLPSLREC